jgi:hypothetical protein
MAMKIKISGSEPIEYGPHDFQLGDYVYAPASLDDPQQGNLLSCVDSQDDEFVHVTFAWIDRTVGRNYEDLCLVPITEEWLKENPQVFTICSDVRQPNENLKFSYQYQFFAKRFNCDYRIVVYELHYEDEEEYQRLCREGLNWFTCINESQGKATIAQILTVSHLKTQSSLVYRTTGVMQVISIHDLQHFLRLCGCEELKIPQSLLED